MTRTVASASAASLALLLHLGCSSDDSHASPVPGAEGGAQDAGDASVDGSLDAAPDAPLGDAGTIGAFCDGSVKALVGAFEQCCSMSDKQLGEYMFIDALFRVVVQSCGSQLSTSIGKGRATYDASSGAACVGMFQTLIGGGVCLDKPEVIGGKGATFSNGPCKTAIVGKQAEGAACSADYECVDGLTCVGYTQSSDGVCRQPPPLAATCGAARGDGGGGNLDIQWGFGTHPSCASGAYCDTGTMTCVATQAQGGNCFEDIECDSGLQCHLRRCGTAGPADANGTCLSASDCKPGLMCASMDGGAAGTCQPKLGAGGACTGGFFSNQCKGVCEVPDGGTSGTCASFCRSG